MPYEVLILDPRTLQVFTAQNLFPHINSFSYRFFNPAGAEPFLAVRIITLPVQL